jgi:hypothetical protein
MAVFTVHLPKVAAGGTPASETIVFLRDGFSAPAFIFGPFWLAWHRAWLPALLIGALQLLIALGGERLFRLSGDGATIVSLGLAAALGFEGARLVAWSLARKGYVESAVVTGHDQEEAEEAFFLQRGAVQMAPKTEAPAPAEGTPA